MAAGVPVVATAVAAVAEVVGPAAELVAPGDPAAMAAAIDTVVTDRIRRAELVRAGRDQCALYPLDRSAAGLASVYRELATAD
jgi:glycosyltransferase involved in cell wall biosynthesis